MSYSAEISRRSPAAFIFLLDQSASMQDPFGGGKRGKNPDKAEILAKAVNRLLRNLILRCAKEDGVRDYFHIGVIGYGSRVQPLVVPAEGFGAPGDLIPISHLAERPLRMEERIDQDERKVKFPIWFEPHAKNGTPMCRALDMAAATVRSWIEVYPANFPPVVLNITDGEATDGDPLRWARKLREFSTDDGQVLLFNVHLSASGSRPVAYPDSPDGLPDEFAHTLFQMSSVLPFPMRAAAEGEGYQTTLDSRGFVFNADPVALVRFLEIGTRPGNLR